MFFVVAGTKQCCSDQGDHKEEPGEEPEPAGEGDQDPEGVD